jgi:hypothetical protein
MINSEPVIEMSSMFERLRLQLYFRKLKTQQGSDQALTTVLEALRLEFSNDLGITRPPALQVGDKNSPVRIQ